MPRHKKLMPRIVLDIEGFRSGFDFKPLSADQKKGLLAVTPLRFPAADWGQIERARAELTWARWSRPQAIEARDFMRRLNAVETAVDGLLRALTGNAGTAKVVASGSPIDKTSTQLIVQLFKGSWLRGTEEDANVLLAAMTEGGQGTRSYSFDKISILLNAQLFEGLPAYLELISKLDTLRSRSQDAIKYSERQQDDPWRGDWCKFVSSLESVFKRNGGKATAAKRWHDEHRQSPFVIFVTAVVKTLPKMAQLHVHSPGAMAKAVADARAKYRKKRPNRAGRLASDSSTKPPSTGN